MKRIAERQIRREDGDDPHALEEASSAEERPIRGLPKRKGAAVAPPAATPNPFAGVGLGGASFSFAGAAPPASGVADAPKPSPFATVQLSANPTAAALSGAAATPKSSPFSAVQLSANPAAATLSEAAATPNPSPFATVQLSANPTATPPSAAPATPPAPPPGTAAPTGVTADKHAGYYAGLRGLNWSLAKSLLGVLNHADDFGNLHGVLRAFTDEYHKHHEGLASKWLERAYALHAEMRVAPATRPLAATHAGNTPANDAVASQLPTPGHDGARGSKPAETATPSAPSLPPRTTAMLESADAQVPTREEGSAARGNESDRSADASAKRPSTRLMERPAAAFTPADAASVPSTTSSAPLSVTSVAPSSATSSAPSFAALSAPSSAPSFASHSAAPSASHSAAPSAPHSAAPSAPHSAAPSAPHSAAPSAPHSAAPSAPHSAPPSAPTLPASATSFSFAGKPVASILAGSVANGPALGVPTFDIPSSGFVFDKDALAAAGASPWTATEEGPEKQGPPAESAAAGLTPSGSAAVGLTSFGSAAAGVKPSASATAAPTPSANGDTSAHSGGSPSAFTNVAIGPTFANTTGVAAGGQFKFGAAPIAFGRPRDEDEKKEE
ncbi:hypothetical protein MSPP1_000827 [Malassezia sp. CBS 17886]|nr:hypothetical protein MSPP1_000827 [Malassezia sp. CBS 17886]